MQMNNLPNKKSRIEDVKRRLYSKYEDQEFNQRADLRDKKYEQPGDWDDNSENQSEDFFQEPKKKFNLFSVFLSIAILFFITASAYAGFNYYKNKQVNQSGSDVDIKIIGPVSVGGGEELSLDVIVQNNNFISMETVDFIVNYPQGTKSSQDLSLDQTRTKERIEDIGPGEILRKNVTSTLFGEEADLKQIEVVLEYRIEGSSAIFEKKKTFEIALNASPIRLTVEGLDQVSSGQTVKLKYNIESNTSQELKNVLVSVNYPFGFNLENSTTEPSFNDNIWLFENISPGDKKTVEITGTIQGQNNEDRGFRFETGLASPDNLQRLDAVFSSVFHNIVVKEAFLALSLELNNTQNTTVIADGDDTISGHLIFRNNTRNAINDVQLELELNGNIIIEETVSGDGAFYRSSDNILIWSKENNFSLEKVEPDKEFKLAFRFDTKDLESGNYVEKNPEIRINAKVSANRVSEANVEEAIFTDTFRNIKIGTEVPIVVYTNYAVGPFQNTGPIPPVVEENTTYTGHLEISNSSNRLENIQISGNIPSYVAWKNRYAPNSEKVTFDSGNRKFAWEIDSLEPGTGYSLDSKKLDFQLELFPSISQKGKIVELVTDLKLNALDTFTGERIEIKLKPINTILKEREGLIDDHEKVIE